MPIFSPFSYSKLSAVPLWFLGYFLDPLRRFGSSQLQLLAPGTLAVSLALTIPSTVAALLYADVLSFSPGKDTICLFPPEGRNTVCGHSCTDKYRQIHQITEISRVGLFSTFSSAEGAHPGSNVGYFLGTEQTVSLYASISRGAAVQCQCNPKISRLVKTRSPYPFENISRGRWSVLAYVCYQTN